MLHKGNYITTAAAAAAVENLSLDVDRKTVAAAAYGAWPNAITATDKLDSAARDLVLDRHRLCEIDDHGALSFLGRRSRQAGRSGQSPPAIFFSGASIGGLMFRGGPPWLALIAGVVLVFVGLVPGARRFRAVGVRAGL